MDDMQVDQINAPTSFLNDLADSQPKKSAFKKKRANSPGPGSLAMRKTTGFAPGLNEIAAATGAFAANEDDEL